MIEAIAIDDAIQPINGLTNRWQKRCYEQEAMRIVKHLELINTTFIYELFDEGCKASYKALYEKYLQDWLDKVVELCKKGKIKYVGIDIHWFTRNYQPITH